ncbi:autotransporter outer membrane beta-barrel domain-containing protein [Leminorella grimontii]|uniref:autotransporter outer membrane beta-barrel domain-containing protein n=1 Tax=Leminorella grimontii TaxID=82981 RepID=UPI00322080F9
MSSSLAYSSLLIQRKIGLTKLSLLVSLVLSAMPQAIAQLGPVSVTTNQSVTLPDGESVMAPSGSAILVSGGGSVIGKDMSIGSSARNEKTISVSDRGSLVTLYGMTVVNSNGIGVYASNDGQVSLGQGTVINVNADVGNRAAGIYIDNTAMNDSAFGSDMVICVDRQQAGVDSYARMGLVLQGAGAYASFDRLSIEGNAVNVGGFLANGAELTMTNSRVYVAGASLDDGLIYWPVNVYYVDVRNTGFTLWNQDVLNLTNTDIIMDNQANSGIIVKDGSQLNMVGGKIVLTEATNGSYGIYGYVGGEINLQDVQVIMQGNADKGIVAHHSQTLNADGVNISSYGTDSIGVRVAKSSNGWLNNSTISGYGNAFTGVIVGIDSKLVSDALTVSATGDASTGMSIVDGGQATLNDGTISVEGSQTTGISVISGTLTANGLNVVANGESASALKNGDSVSITNGRLAAAGNKSNAVILSNSGSLTLTDSTVEGGGASVFTVQGISNIITLDRSSAVAKNDAQLLALADGGTVALTADNVSRLYGDAYAGTGSDASLTLNGASAWQGGAQNVGAVALNDGSLWQITRHSDVGSLALNNGALAFTAPSSSDFKTLTVRGNYSAQSGAVSLNTRLGGDDSLTDRLIVQGNTQGETLLQVANAGGQGAKTAEGIPVVQVLGDSNGSFKLNGRVVAGLYDYHLYQGSASNPDDGNWYLRTDYLAPTPSDGSGETPSVIDGGPSVTPLRPEVGSYLSNLSTASTMFVHTMHERLGEPQFTDAYKGNDAAPSLWLRIAANKAQDTVHDLDQTSNTSVVQLGGDIAQWSSNGSDRYHVGLMGGYGRNNNHSRSTITHDYSSSKVTGYSVGAYGTWFKNGDEPTGPYVDVWSQYGWYKNKVNGSGLPEESYDSRGWTTSVESGYAFVAKESERYQLMLEPQAQVAWNNFSQDNHTESNGTRVTDGDASGLITRMGVRLYRHDKQNRNGIQPFVETNWWYSGADNTLKFNGEKVEDGTPSSRLEVKVGLQGEVAKGWQVWGHVGQQWGANDYTRYEGMVGVKMTF